MRFSAAVVALLSVGATSSAAPAWLDSFDVDVTPSGLTKVPGDSPLEFCDGDHSKDIITIEKVDLSPNPPQTYVLPPPPPRPPASQSCSVVPRGNYAREHPQRWSEMKPNNTRASPFPCEACTNDDTTLVAPSSRSWPRAP